MTTWTKYRRPGNRVEKYSVRILNRIENENQFTLGPMYISALNNKLKDELSRLEHREAIKFGREPRSGLPGRGGESESIFRQSDARFLDNFTY